jgi:hypothetical protein
MKTGFTKKYLLGAALGLLAILPSAAFAADFTNASLAGRYAIVLTGGGGRTPTAGVGVVEADAAGNLEGETKFNVPDAQPGQREFITVPLLSRYEINPDGTGKIRELLCSITEATLVITRAERRFVRSGAQLLPREKIALEIALLGRELAQPEMTLVTATLYRLPDGAFTSDSFAGAYALTIKAAGGAPPSGAVGVFSDKAAGVFKGHLSFNVVDPQTGQRMFLEMPSEGTYTVNPDGAGRITFLSGPVKEVPFRHHAG